MPREDAFANAQALLDNGEGKHVDNGSVSFSLSEMDRDGTTQRRKEPSVNRGSGPENGHFFKWSLNHF